MFRRWLALMVAPPLERRRTQVWRHSCTAARRFGSGFERLEDREVPAIVFFNVNTTNDTPMVAVVNNVPLDLNGNTSLRAVVDYANANPLTGNPSVNNYSVSLTTGTITLDPNLGTLVVESNMSFIALQLATEEGYTTGTTVQRNVGAAAFRLFQVDDDMSVDFFNMTLQGGRDESGGAILVDPNAAVMLV